MAELTAAAVAKLTVPKLKEALAARGLDATGLKAVLVERLQLALAPSPPAAGGEAEEGGAPAASMDVDPAPPPNHDTLAAAATLPTDSHAALERGSLTRPSAAAAPPAAVPAAEEAPARSPPSAAAPPPSRSALLPSEPPAQAQPGGGLTVRALQADRVTQLAEQAWRRCTPVLDNALVKRLYAEELNSGAPAAQRASVLEISQVRSTSLARRRQPSPFLAVP